MRFFKVFLVLSMLLFLQIGLLWAQEIDYGIWNKVLTQYVNHQGRVNYKKLKVNRQEFDIFIKQIEQVNLSEMTENEKKAFWINAYNAVTLKVVLDAYPVKGIRRINFGLVWNIPRSVAKTKISLGDIEHKILRPLGDPRIHFAINCASIGCPELSNEPFYPQVLDEKLDSETRKFVNDSKKVRLDQKNNTLYYSAIFDWFEEDFLVEHESVESFIVNYLNEQDKAFLDINSVKLQVLEYDWGLNE